MNRKEQKRLLREADPAWREVWGTIKTTPPNRFFANIMKFARNIEHLSNAGQVILLFAGRKTNTISRAKRVMKRSYTLFKIHFHFLNLFSHRGQRELRDMKAEDEKEFNPAPSK